MDGVLKEKSDLAPNGYFFLPIYDGHVRRYKVVLSVPDGWSVGTVRLPLLD